MLKHPSTNCVTESIMTVMVIRMKKLLDGVITRAGRVFKNVKKELATHLPTASLVLEKRVGDCTEHTWLFVALARAAGGPDPETQTVMHVRGRV